MCSQLEEGVRAMRMLFARMNVDEEAEDEFHAWYDNEHMDQARAIPGFGSEHRRYEAVSLKGKHWDYRPNPRFTAIYEVDGDADLLSTVNSDEYKSWSGDFLAKWQKRTQNEVSVLTEQIFGAEGQVDHDHVLLVQMNVIPEHEQEFNDWYDSEHIPQTPRIPGFGTDHRRFRSLEVEGKYWHYKALPKYTAVYSIEAGADLLKAINSKEYKTWSGDFLERWRDRTRDEVSTICRRIY